MIYFCADDYGMSACGNSRIENCLENGVLNKVSVLLNGEISDFKQRLSGSDTTLSLHINLVEGRPLSEPNDVDLLISDDGYFKYSFVGLFFLSMSNKRKEFEKQIYIEIQNQIRVWKIAMGDNTSISIDSHQHTHMIPLIFKILMRVIRDEDLSVSSIRIPAEPISPYLFTPSLYFEYKPIGLIKQWLLKILALVNRNELVKSKIKSAYFMGIMFSGKLNEARIKKLLPNYLKLAEKENRDIEIGFHPGYVKSGEKLIDGSRQDFSKFYYSPWRNTEYNTLLSFNYE
ncbi:MAG: ChbG/HpnK family deacetylase [Clostridia bacterium]|nr:ChbG/HpnK family deacetylase [Clostridia bacterium]